MLSSEQKNVLLQIINGSQFSGKDLEVILEIKKELSKKD